MGDGGANNVAVCYSFDALASNSMKSSNPHSGCRETECSKTLDCFDPNPSKNQGGIAVVQPAICIQGNCIDRADTARCNGRGWRDDDVSYTLNTIDRPAVYDARDNGDGNTAPTLTGDHQNRVTDYTAVCMTQQAIGEYKESEIGSALKQRDYKDAADLVCAVDCRNGTENPETNGTLQAKSNGGMSLNLQNTVRVASLVRRLTPMECERLQGYPDGWTDLGEWVDSRGKVHQTSDSARYKALGNSIALPPWRFVLGRLNAYLTEHTMASLFDGISGFVLIWAELNGTDKVKWVSEIEEFPIAVCRRHFGDEKIGLKGDWDEIFLGRNQKKDV
jgi:DNA (cytosine-5)-methyltransferase 1